MAQKERKIVGQKYLYVRDSQEPVSYLQYDGIFDFDSLYKLMHDWLVDRNYYFEEKLYKHKVPNPSGAEQHLVWTAWRNVNEYVKFWIDIYIQIKEMKEIEAIRKGEKKKMTKAKILIVFAGKVELDYNKKFTKSLLGQYLHDFLVSYVWTPEKEVAMWWDELYYRVYKYQRVVKDFLDMETKSNAYYDMW